MARKPSTEATPPAAAADSRHDTGAGVEPAAEPAAPADPSSLSAEASGSAAASTSVPPELAAPARHETPPPPPSADDEDERMDAARVLAALVQMRKALARIHARQKHGRDGTAAAGAFAGALLSVGGGLPHFPPNPWPLKQTLDRPTYPEGDPDCNQATKALVALLFDCLEDGRRKPGRCNETLARMADRWTGFANRAEAIRFEEAHAKAEDEARHVVEREAHFRRLAERNPPPRARAKAPEPPEPIEPDDVTVG